MLLAIINGFLLDRVRFHLLLVPEYLVAGLGFLLLTLVDSPISASGRFLLIVASTSAISSNVIASIMIIKSIREHDIEGLGDESGGEGKRDDGVGFDCMPQLLEFAHKATAKRLSSVSALVVVAEEEEAVDEREQSERATDEEHGLKWHVARQPEQKEH